MTLSTLAVRGGLVDQIGLQPTTVSQRHARETSCKLGKRQETYARRFCSTYRKGSRELKDGEW